LLSLPSASEFEIHAAIVDWLTLALPRGSLLHHSPNEGRHHVRYRTKLKRLGLHTGWPDLELLVPIEYWLFSRGRSSGHVQGFQGDQPQDMLFWGPIFLEVKAARGKLTKAQKAVLEQLTALGAHCAIVRSIDETRDFLAERVELFANG